MPATRVTIESSPVLLSSSVGLCLNAARRAAGHGDRHRFPDAGAGAVRSARHPYRLIDARRLEEVDAEQHIDDLVRIVLLTGPGERLHRPDFGAGLGAATLFEPLDDPLASIVEVRARGSLDRALGDRIEVLEVKVGRSGESTLLAEVTYRLRGSDNRSRRGGGA